jgi:hypothetical protein
VSPFYIQGTALSVSANLWLAIRGQTNHLCQNIGYLGAVADVLM